MINSDEEQTKSEETLGKAGAPKRFIIDTKAPGFSLGAMSKENVLKGIDQSLKDLGVSSVSYGLRSEEEFPVD